MDAADGSPHDRSHDERVLARPAEAEGRIRAGRVPRSRSPPLPPSHGENVLEGEAASMGSRSRAGVLRAVEWPQGPVRGPCVLAAWRSVPGGFLGHYEHIGATHRVLPTGPRALSPWAACEREHLWDDSCVSVPFEAPHRRSGRVLLHEMLHQRLGVTNQQHHACGSRKDHSCYRGGALRLVEGGRDDLASRNNDNYVGFARAVAQIPARSGGRP